MEDEAEEEEGMVENDTVVEEEADEEEDEAEVEEEEEEGMDAGERDEEMADDGRVTDLSSGNSSSSFSSCLPSLPPPSLTSFCNFLK